jgi:hypothetical protein
MSLGASFKAVGDRNESVTSSLSAKIEAESPAVDFIANLLQARWIDANLNCPMGAWWQNWELCQYG